MVTTLTFAAMTAVLVTAVVGWVCYWRGYKKGAEFVRDSGKMYKNVQLAAQKQFKPARVPPHLSFGYADFSPEPAIGDAADDANIYYAQCPFCDAAMGNGQMKCTRCGKWTWEDQ